MKCALDVPLLLYARAAGLERSHRCCVIYMLLRFRWNFFLELISNAGSIAQPDPRSSRTCNQSVRSGNGPRDESSYHPVQRIIKCRTLTYTRDSEVLWSRTVNCVDLHQKVLLLKVLASGLPIFLERINKTRLGQMAEASSCVTR